MYFNEDMHPRMADGKFAKKGTSNVAAAKKYLKSVAKAPAIGDSNLKVNAEKVVSQSKEAISRAKKYLNAVAKSPVIGDKKLINSARTILKNR
jgi:hypothetical protein